MDLVDRAILMLIGGIIGFGFGYVVRFLQDMKEELDEVDMVVKELKKNEKGFMRHPIVADIALITVLILVVWATLRTQEVSTDVQQNQKTLSRITYCNQHFIIETIDDLNERTTFTVEQAQANIELQKAQSAFLAVLLLDPPAPEERQDRELRVYFNTLTEYVTVNAQTVNKVRGNPFATSEEVAACFDGRVIPRPQETE